MNHNQSSCSPANHPARVFLLFTSLVLLLPERANAQTALAGVWSPKEVSIVLDSKSATFERETVGDKGPSEIKQDGPKKRRRAIAEYREAVRKNPWDAFAHLMLGVTYHAQGSFGQAAEHYENAMMLRMWSSGQGMAYHVLQALCLKRAGNGEKAQILFKELSWEGGAIKRDVKYLQGDLEEERYLSKSRKDGYLAAYLFAGIYNKMKGKLEKAREYLQFFIERIETVFGEEYFGWFYFIAKAELESMDQSGRAQCFKQRAEEHDRISVELGTPKDLRDVQTVYVSAERRDRRNIIKHLEKYEGITIVDALEGKKPDVILVFGSKRYYTTEHIDINNEYSTFNMPHGSGKGLAVRLLDGDKLRVLWRFEGTELFRHPSTNFARKFIKMLKKEREEK